MTNITPHFSNTKVNAKDILLTLFQKYRNEVWVLSKKEIEQKRDTFFPGIWRHVRSRNFSNLDIHFGLDFGLVINSLGVLILIDRNTYSYTSLHGEVSLNFINSCFILKGNNTISVRAKKQHLMQISTSEYNFLEEFLNEMKIAAQAELIILNRKANEIRKNELDQKLQFEESIIVAQFEFDSNRNGCVDRIEGDDVFKNLLKKHQANLSVENKEHVLKFVKISNHLKKKRENI